MKRILLIWMLISLGGASASRSSPDNLGNITPCFRLLNIQVSDSTKAIDQYASYEQVKKKLTAYRIPFQSSDLCENMPWVLHFLVESVTAPNGIIAYSYSLDVYDRSSGIYSDAISIWSAGGFGVAPTKEILVSAIKNGLTEMIDSFAADYAKANP